MATLNININDTKFTTDAWQGFIRMHPIPTDDEGQPTVDTSTTPLKLAYVESVLKRMLAHSVRRGMDLNARTAAPARPDPDFDVTE